MQYIRFEESSETFDIALLIKFSAFKEGELRQAYVNPLRDKHVPASSIMAVNLPYNTQGKIPVKYARDYLADTLPVLVSVGVKTLYVADAAYFKALTKLTKAEPYLGYAVPCKLDGFEHLEVILGVNHHSLLYNPANESKLELSLDTLAQHYNGALPTLGENVLKNADYLDTVEEIGAGLQALLEAKKLYADIEAFSLKKVRAGIGTIAFAWNKHSGIAFCSDYQEIENPDKYQGEFVPNPAVRQLLKDFFTQYKGELYWHRGNYDVSVIISTLWMEGLDDWEGLLEGLSVMCREGKWHDTRLIAYLALNSCSRQDLSLKSLAHRHAGNWAHNDIKDIRKIPKRELLKYNLIDAACTAYVADTYIPKMLEDQQGEVYKMFMESQKTIVQMELTGLPVNIQSVQKLSDYLSNYIADQDKVIAQHPAYQEATYIHQQRLAEAKNKKLVKLVKTAEDFKDEILNVDSGQQLALLLFEVIGLPVIEETDTGQPATGKDVLKALKNHTDSDEEKALLGALMNRAQAVKIQQTFIPAFMDAEPLRDNTALLQGSFNLGGAVSGRMSSSDPNLQNIPAGSEYGKKVKECFEAPSGWLYVGADFNSLEDYISALTTKDPNKLKVYSGLKQYKVTVNGKTQIITEESEIKYEGEILTGGELYEKLQSR